MSLPFRPQSFSSIPDQDGQNSKPILLLPLARPRLSFVRHHTLAGFESQDASLAIVRSTYFQYDYHCWLANRHYPSTTKFTEWDKKRHMARHQRPPSEHESNDDSHLFRDFSSSTDFEPNSHQRCNRRPYCESDPYQSRWPNFLADKDAELDSCIADHEIDRHWSHRHILCGAKEGGEESENWVDNGWTE